MNWLKKRAKEPSTYAGLGAVLGGLAQLADKPQLAAAGNAVQNAGQAVLASGGDPTVAIGAIVAGLLAVFMREKSGQVK